MMELNPTWKTATVGQAVAIQCKTTVEADVKWVYYNDSLNPGEQLLANEGRVVPKYVDIYALNSSGKNYHALIVKHSKLEDTGLYECIEDTGVGNIHKSCLCVTDLCSTTTTACNNTIPLPSTNNCDNNNSTEYIIALVVVSSLLVVLVIIAVVYKLKEKRQKSATRAGANNSSQTKNASETPCSPLLRPESRQEDTVTKNSVKLDSTSYQEAEKDDGAEPLTRTVQEWKLHGTIVPDASRKNMSSRVFTIMEDSLFLINADEKKIEVYSIDVDSTGTRNQAADIDLANFDLKKPCCCVASNSNNCFYVGDRKSREILKVLPQQKTVELWTTVKCGKMRSISNHKDGLAVLINEEGRVYSLLCRGKVHVYDSTGRYCAEIKVPASCYFPHCIETIDDEHFSITFGMFNKSGLAIFSEEEGLIATVGCKYLAVPSNFYYDRKKNVFIIADPGTKNVLFCELKGRQIGKPYVLKSWGDAENIDPDIDAVCPVSVAYDSTSHSKRKIVALLSGRIDLYLCEM